MNITCLKDELKMFVARTIQEELLKEFATNSDLSDVFSKVRINDAFQEFLTDIMY